MDCYLVATAVPSYIVTILAGSLSVTFIPAFVDKKDTKERWNLMGSILFLSVIVGASVTALIIIFSPQIINQQAPGLSAKLQNYSALLLNWYVIVLLFTVINEIFAGIFYSIGEFMVPALNKIISPIITTSIVFVMSSGANALIIVWANVAGVLVQTILLLYKFFSEGNRIQIGNKIFTREVRSVLKLMTPLLIGSIFYKSLPIFDKYFLSNMTLGSISVINYSQKLFLATAQILGAALSMQVFSHLALLASELKHDELNKLLNKLIRLALFVTIPVAGLCYFFSDEIIRLIYERGEFTSANTSDVVINFRIYMLALPAVILGTIISQGLYVMKDTWSPFYVGLVEILLYLALCYFLVGIVGIIALPIAYVIYFYFSVIVLGVILATKLKFIRWDELLAYIFVLITLILSELTLIHFIFGTYLFSSITTIIVLLFSVLIYFVVAYSLNNNEAKFIFNKVLSGTSKILASLQDRNR
jgi:putative peptidoglycan lipid II flippase